MEFKFRAGHFDDGKGCKGCTKRVLVIYLEHNELTIMMDEDRGTQVIWTLDNCELLQFTGEVDIHGVDIYAGDIVINPMWGECGLPTPKLVEFNNGRFEIIGLSLMNWYSECEIVGNKFENPELIKRK